MSEPYKVEGRGDGCPTCQHDEQYDIIGPDGSAQSQSWGDKDEADYICDLLNIAHQQGRVSYAEEVLERLKGEVNAQEQTKKIIVEAPKPFRTTTPEGEDIPF